MILLQNPRERLSGSKTMKQNVLPNLLIEIVEFLKQQNLHLSQQSRDGRINSAFNEDEIFNLLDSNFAINRPNMQRNFSVMGGF